MKKILAGICLMLICYADGKAQYIVNPVVGVNSFALSEVPQGTTQQQDGGFEIGVNLRIGRRFYFQPGVHFLSEQNVLRLDTALTPTEIKTDFTTLAIPIVVGTKLLDMPDEGVEPFNIILQTGLMPRILLSAKDHDTKEYRKNYFNQFNFGVLFGVGFEFYAFTLDLNGELGLSKFYDVTNSANGGFTAKPMVFHIDLGYKFLMGGEE
jgi:hypothetical protein